MLGLFVCIFIILYASTVNIYHCNETTFFFHSPSPIFSPTPPYLYIQSTHTYCLPPSPPINRISSSGTSHDEGRTILPIAVKATRLSYLYNVEGRGYPEMVYRRQGSLGNDGGVQKVPFAILSTLSLLSSPPLPGLFLSSSCVCSMQPASLFVTLFTNLTR